MVTQRVLPTPMRVRELIEVAAALLSNVRVTAQPVSPDGVYEAFSAVRQMIDELAMDESPSKSTLAMLSNWQRRYVQSDDVRATFRSDLLKFTEDSASIVISLENRDRRTAKTVAKFFAWRISLFVETIGGIWPDEPENVTRLEELTRMAKELLAVVDEV